MKITNENKFDSTDILKGKLKSLSKCQNKLLFDIEFEIFLKRPIEETDKIVSIINNIEIKPFILLHCVIYIGFKSNHLCKLDYD